MTTLTYLAHMPALGIHLRSVNTLFDLKTDLALFQCNLQDLCITKTIFHKIYEVYSPVKMMFASTERRRASKGSYKPHNPQALAQIYSSQLFGTFDLLGYLHSYGKRLDAASCFGIFPIQISFLMHEPWSRICADSTDLLQLPTNGLYFTFHYLLLRSTLFFASLECYLQHLKWVLWEQYTF